MEYVPFEQKVQLAIDAVLKIDLGARLQEVMMPSNLSSAHCVFRAAGGGAIFAEVTNDLEVTTRQNSWQWGQDNLLDLPTEVSFNEALNLFAEAFPRKPWFNVTLRCGARLPNLGPEYVFSVGGGYVIVDVSRKGVYMLER